MECDITEVVACRHESWRKEVISELIGGGAATIAALLRDGYGNYVMQNAINAAEDMQAQQLGRLIHPRLPFLRKNIRKKWERLLAARGCALRFAGIGVGSGANSGYGPSSGAPSTGSASGTNGVQAFPHSSVNGNSRGRVDKRGGSSGAYNSRTDRGNEHGTQGRQRRRPQGQPYAHPQYMSPSQPAYAPQAGGLSPQQALYQHQFVVQSPSTNSPYMSSPGPGPSYGMVSPPTPQTPYGTGYAYSPVMQQVYLQQPMQSSTTKMPQGPQRYQQPQVLAESVVAC